MIDKGDRLIVRPVLSVDELQGLFAGPGPTSDEMRAEMRADEQAAEKRREAQRYSS